jgi:pyruvate formate lyase activating enzyme
MAGVLYTLTYDKLCAAHVDPIEKKPLYHFYPGSKSYSIATEGCNFRCDFCQNWQISQQPAEYGTIEGSKVLPEQIVQAAIKSHCKSISYTYTEPTIFMELAADCARLARQHGLVNVFVSNGYMTRQAIDLASKWLDAINVDLKAFTDQYYRKHCKAELGPVLENISYIARHTRIWIEVTTLLVPGQNDGKDELKALADWLVQAAGPDVPWHISRFYPQYKLTDARPTPIETLEQAYQIGRECGIHYVYMGNVPGCDQENSYCHNCGQLLIERNGYMISTYRISAGLCPDCGTKIPGVGL